MPAYKYVCAKCQATEMRITGVNDHVVVCVNCGHLMKRNLDPQTILDPYKFAAQR